MNEAGRRRKETRHVLFKLYDTSMGVLGGLAAAAGTCMVRLQGGQVRARVTRAAGNARRHCVCVVCVGQA